MNDFPLVDDPLKACHKFWNLYRPFPRPKKPLRCPCCQQKKARIKDYYFHYYAASRTKYRCDIAFKCINCSLVWTHGVVIPIWLFYRHRERRYTWREVMEIEHALATNTPMYRIVIYVADDNTDPDKWYRKQVEVKSADDIGNILDIYGTNVAFDLAYFMPHNDVLKQRVIDVLSMRNAKTVEYVLSIVKLAGTKLYDRI